LNLSHTLTRKAINSRSSSQNLNTIRNGGEDLAPRNNTANKTARYRVSFDTGDKLGKPTEHKKKVKTKLEEKNAQRLYIKKLSPTSKKHLLARPHKNLSCMYKCTAAVHQEGIAKQQKHLLATPPPNIRFPIESVIRTFSRNWAGNGRDRTEIFSLNTRNIFQPKPATN